MTREDVLAKLCYNDPRNPNGIINVEPEKASYYTPYCCCHNCADGKTPLALELLKYIDKEKS